jgi:exopolysaccharide biosynthesis protein
MDIKQIRKYNSRITVVKFRENTIYRTSISTDKPGKQQLSKMFGEPTRFEVPIIRNNLGFFGGSAEHYGSFVKDGKIIQYPSANFMDMILYNNGKLDIANHSGTASITSILPNIKWSTGTSFSLIQDGKINLENCENFSHYKEKHPRTAIGQTASGEFVVCIVDGRWYLVSTGVTGYDLAQIMLDEGCVYAANADGGGSTEVIYLDKIYNRPSDGAERLIGSMFVVYKKLFNTLDLPYLGLSWIRYPYRRGIYVHLCQRNLSFYGIDPGPLDGIIGAKTINAVKVFQKKIGAIVDGVVGPVTWGKLLS